MSVTQITDAIIFFQESKNIDEVNIWTHPGVKDTENVPPSESIQEYLDREIKPYIPEAWINKGIRYRKDGDVDKIGYEINFNHYFYKYVLSRHFEEIEVDINKLEKEIIEMIKEI